MKSISIEEWADKYGIPPRKAYRWADSGKLPTCKRKIEVRGVPETITLKDVVKGK